MENFPSDSCSEETEQLNYRKPVAKKVDEEMAKKEAKEEVGKIFRVSGKHKWTQEHI